MAFAIMVLAGLGDGRAGFINWGLWGTAEVPGVAYGIKPDTSGVSFQLKAWFETPEWSPQELEKFSIPSQGSRIKLSL